MIITIIILLSTIFILSIVSIACAEKTRRAGKKWYYEDI